jgi:hypothetical protein
MSSYLKNVSGVKVLSLILTDNTSIQLTGGVGGQELTLELNQDTTGGWTVSNGGNVPGLQQPNPTVKTRSTQQLLYDASTNTWNAAPNAVVAAGAQGPTTIAYGASGAGLAINKNSGWTILNGAGVVAATLAVPVAGPPGVGDDGLVLKVSSASAHAHTITTPSLGIAGVSDTITFTALAGDGITLQAYDGLWYATGGQGATISVV